MKHGGTDHVKGELHKGAMKPRIYANHGGTNLRQGEVRDAAAPKPPQSSTSWHAAAAASLKRK